MHGVLAFQWPFLLHKFIVNIFMAHAFCAIFIWAKLFKLAKASVGNHLL
jgi:hypothetical protein